MPSYHYEAFDEDDLSSFKVRRFGILSLYEIRGYALQDMIKCSRKEHINMVCAIYSVTKAGAKETWYKLQDDVNGYKLIKIKDPHKKVGKPNNILKFRINKG